MGMFDWLGQKESSTTATEEQIEVKSYELQSQKPAILRAYKELDSPKTGLLAPWSIVQVLQKVTLEDGTVRARLDVQTGDGSHHGGWVTMSKPPTKETRTFLRAVGNTPNSSSYEVVAQEPLIVRKQADLASTNVGEVAPGSIIEVLETATMLDGCVRARTKRGWLTMSKLQKTEGVDYLFELSAQQVWERGGAVRVNATKAAEMNRIEQIAQPIERRPPPVRNPKFYDLAPYGQEKRSPTKSGRDHLSQELLPPSSPTKQAPPSSPSKGTSSSSPSVLRPGSPQSAVNRAVLETRRAPLGLGDLEWKNAWPNYAPLKVSHPDEAEVARFNATEIQKFMEIEALVTQKGVALPDAATMVVQAHR